MDPLLRLLKEAVVEILRTEDSAAFLSWMRERAPHMVPELFEVAPDTQTRRALATVLGTAVWNVTPLPGNGFRPRPLGRPGRNDPCPCGSGRKYRQCCAGMPEAPTFITAEMMWVVLAEQLPAPKLAELASAGQLPREVLGEVARDWVEAGESRRVVRLLEPLFEDGSGLDERDEVALEALLDAYDHLGHWRKKERLMQRLSTELQPALRCALWQRRATVLADQGDWDGAWQAFQQAQRDDPDHPALGLLEVTLLTHQGRSQQAAERARFWLARLEREQGEKPGRVAELLREVVRDPSGAMLGVLPGRAEGVHVRRFHLLVDAAVARPVPAYVLEQEAGDPSQVALTAPPALAKVERRWHSEVHFDKPYSIALTPESPADVWLPETAERWLGFLEKHPQALDSVDVLDDLAWAVDDLEIEPVPWIDEALVAPLLDRARQILDVSLANAPDSHLPWTVERNRPALRALVRKVQQLERQGDAQGARALMERLLRLNPNDNHGYRAPLANLYLRGGEDERVLELAAAYPRDFYPELAYGRVMALYRLGRKGEALNALKDATEHLPLVAKYLLAARPRRPASQAPDGFVQVGGAEQAWMYRQEMGDLWQSTTGLLEWVRQAGRSTTRRQPRRGT